MNIKCLFKGHDYKYIEETFIDDFQEAFYASNLGTSIVQYGHNVYQCQRCLKRKLILNGKRRIQ